MLVSAIVELAQKTKQMTIQEISGVAKKIFEWQAAQKSTADCGVGFGFDGHLSGVWQLEDRSNCANCPFGLSIIYSITTGEEHDKAVVNCRLHTWGPGWLRCDRVRVVNDQVMFTGEEMYFWDSRVDDYVPVNKLSTSVVH